MSTKLKSKSRVLSGHSHRLHYAAIFSSTAACFVSCPAILTVSSSLATQVCAAGLSSHVAQRFSQLKQSRLPTFAGKISACNTGNWNKQNGQWSNADVDTQSLANTSYRPTIEVTTASSKLRTVSTETRTHLV